ncbi:hypothetical protein ABW20_dc0102569 [Dactylellina cionopaga]|nr:hypothetical protein ABW20_dc0102569 [Dactylellina cionopaga]
MASLTTLPPELCIGIFQHLDNADLARVKRVCKGIKNVAQQVPLRSYIFKVDEPKHSAWKFMRYILLNNSAAEHIIDFNVEWHRREADDPKTWTKPWVWTEEETVLIKRLAETTVTPKLSDGTVEAILSGINSEALLSFLLYFAANIESLDLGEVQVQLIVCDYDSMADGYKALRKVIGSKGGDFEESEETEEEDEDDDDDDWMEAYEELESKYLPESQRSLWLYENLGGPGKYLPGLASIKYLNHDLNDDIFFSEYMYGWKAKNLPAFLFLPRIETIRIGGCATVGMGTHDAISEDLKPFAGYKSTVKTLEFANSRLITDDYIAIAKVTQYISALSIENNEKYWPELEDMPCIVSAFRKFNKDSLKLEDVNIDGYTGDDLGEEFKDYYDLSGGDSIEGP